MYNSVSSRIIPGPKSEHSIVSMPQWAWFWLDDFIENCSPDGYKGLYSAFGDAFNKNGNLSEALHGIAQMHQEFCLRELHNLANDDEPDQTYIQNRVIKPIKATTKKNSRMPKIYKLFGFMSCPTTLESVWERRHYNE